MNNVSQPKVFEFAKEIGMSISQLQVKYVGPRISATISVLYELDLETGKAKSLKLFGGLGGLFMTKDGAIYFSDSSQFFSIQLIIRLIIALS